jgi:hypothetical protein
MFASLSGSHNSFETPCGSYAHFKLTRYLLRVTREARYGDSMERVMYNTVLGAKPTQADGHTFYYSDYNFAGRKVYSDRRWPCCSGTLPQVATDYGINAYFRDERGIYVNLYVPSTVRFQHGSAQVSLKQQSSYPVASHIQFEVTASRPTEFSAKFRIPAWAEGATISVNGKRWTGAVTQGAFVGVRREWNTSDRVELELPLTKRLESIDPGHANTVALLRGPLVLFAIADSNAASPTKGAITREELLAAAKVDKQNWEVKTAGGAVKMRPFTAIGDEQYSTYLTVS